MQLFTADLIFKIHNLLQINNEVQKTKSLAAELKMKSRRFREKKHRIFSSF